jgi:hypothetical protein
VFCGYVGSLGHVRGCGCGWVGSGGCGSSLCGVDWPARCLTRVALQVEGWLGWVEVLFGGFCRQCLSSLAGGSCKAVSSRCMLSAFLLGTSGSEAKGVCCSDSSEPLRLEMLGWVTLLGELLEAWWLSR